VRRTSLSLSVAYSVAGVALLAGCGGSSGQTSSTGSTSATSSASSSDTSAATSSTTAAGATGSITVLAAASLTESFTTIANDFEAAHPGSTVTLSFGPSSGLATQVVNGAPADVFAAASTKTMGTVVDAGYASGPTNFATNSMTIVVPSKNPAKVDSLDDLTNPDTLVAVCQAEVPCGAAAATVFGNAGLTVKPVSEEADVKAVLTKVSLGEVDAGIVYVTDAKAAASDVTAIAIPAADNATTKYPIAAISKAPNPALAKEFVAYVLSDAGQAVLAQAGFAAP